MRIGTAGFVAARLTSAREARGVTQSELAERTGIKPQSICHYEQGRQSPSPEALALLAEKLSLPERHFLRPLPPDSAGLHARLGWLRELAAYVRRFVELPPVQLPLVDLREAVCVESAAETARTFFRTGSGPIASMTILLENHGCIVARLPGSHGHPFQFATLLDGQPYMGLDLESPPSTVRYSAARALGSLVLGGDAARDPLHDRFARAFLMPARTFGPEVWSPTLDAMLGLKRTWNCPIGAIVHRCVDLGLLDEEHARRLVANMARRGWKSEEPGEHDQESESPRILAQSLRLMLDSGVKDVHTLLADLALGSSDVEQLAGLPNGFLREAEPPAAWAPRLRQAAAG